MAHPGRPTGEAVGQKRAHRRPSQPGAEADRVIDLLDRRHVVGDQPQRLAPQRLEQPVGDEAVDLVAYDQRPHAERAVDRLCALDRLGRRAFARAHLDERQQVDGVERVADDQPLGPGHVGGQPRRQQPGGRGRDDRVGGRGAAGPRQQLALERLALGCALLDQLRALDGILDGGHERQRALGRERRGRQPSPGSAAALDLAVGGFERLGRWVVEPDVDPGENQPRRPATADHAAPEQPRGARRVLSRRHRL